MGTITITIREIKHKPKRSLVITADGKQYGCWSDKLHKLGLEEGASFNVETDTFDTDNGTTLFNIISAKRVTMGMTSVPQVPEARRSAPSAPRAPSSNGNGYYRPTSPRDSERMFVCATLGAYIKAGHIQPNRDEVIIAIELLREAYSRTFGVDDRDVEYQEAAE